MFYYILFYITYYIKLYNQLNCIYGCVYGYMYSEFCYIEQAGLELVVLWFNLPSTRLATVCHNTHFGHSNAKIKETL